LSVEPRPVAVIPSATNTSVKLRQNAAAGSRTWLDGRSSRISVSDTPDTALR
jgi:hypothetical protein